MNRLAAGITTIRLRAGFILALAVCVSCTSDIVSSTDYWELFPDKSRPVLLMTDQPYELATLAENLEHDGWTVGRMTQEAFLKADTYVDLSEYSAVMVYIHKTLDPIMEEALISYAEAGEKLVVLHHSLASAKVENSEWLKFLGVSILPGDREFPWKVTAETSHTMVNLAPGHYITSHKVHYDSKAEFSFGERPDLEGSYPAFTMENTEIFHNQRLSGEDEKVILFGYLMDSGEVTDSSSIPAEPEMEPTSGWYKPAGKGWVFYFQPGHTEQDFEHASFSQVLLNCLYWQPRDPEFASCKCLAASEFVTLDMNIDETRTVDLPDGSRAEIRLKAMNHQFDAYRKAVRRAEVRVSVNGEELVLGAGMYNLPRKISGVQIDCPVTSAWVHNRDGSLFNPWSLDRDARLRVWPAESPWIDTAAFGYPADAGWFSSDTQMTSDPCYVDRSDIHREPGTPGSNIYYHYGLDIGGSEGQTVIRSAVDGLILSSGGRTLEDYLENTPVSPRYDVVYVLDSRGWIYRHSHFKSISPEIRPGFRVRKGQKIGKLGKEGGSGGWSHFHFDISRRQPSGRFGSEDGYAFYWQSYFAQNPSRLQAVARPHQLALTGEEILLDGSKSVSLEEKNSGLQYKWILSDGSECDTVIHYIKYDKPGLYSEILQVTDESGSMDHDFCPVFVVDPDKPGAEQPHTIHAAFHPTKNILAGDRITFKVRSFGIDPLDGKEIWDFGDGSPEVEVRSDGNSEVHNPEGYAVTSHAYREPGLYLVSVSRTCSRGYTATARLEVAVGD